MCRTLLFLLFSYSFTFLQAQRVGIGTTSPISKLSIDSGLNIDQANVNGIALESALTFGNNKKVGIGSRRTAGANRAGLDFYTNGVRQVFIDSFGNVGIGVNDPSYRLHISGSAYMTDNAYVMGKLGIGTASPEYAFDNVEGYNHMTYGLGIGTIPTSTYKLDVDGGSARFRQDLRVDGILNPNNTLSIGNNAIIEGELLVKSNKGIVRSQSSEQLKVVRTSITLIGTLSAGGSVNSADFLFETFASTPMVFVGNLISSNSSAWANLEFVPYNVGTNSCNFKVFNHGTTSVSLSATFALLIIGPE